MSITKLQDMINPEVMADMISAELPAKLRFSEVTEVDTTLVGQPGNTITIPTFKLIGDAVDFNEAEALETAVLGTESSQVTIKKVGKAVELTDESMLSGYGDPLGEAQKQLLMSIANKVDNDSLEALKETKIGIEVDSVITPDVISDAIDLFQEEDDEVRVLFVSPKQVGALRKDPAFTRASDLGDEVLVKGSIGEIYGCQVVASRKIEEEEGKFTNIIAKPGALGLYLKRNVLIESDRDILRKTTVLSADQHYGVTIKDETKVVKFTVNAEGTVEE